MGWHVSPRLKSLCDATGASALRGALELWSASSPSVTKRIFGTHCMHASEKTRIHSASPPSKAYIVLPPLHIISLTST